FIGYLRRCEFSVIPCSRMLAPLAQCAPMLMGESNTGSWRTHTPSVTTASMAQPTEQCVHTVRRTTVLPVFAASAAVADPIMPSGSWLAKAAAPAVMPVPLRNARRSTVRAASAVAARASGLIACARPCVLRVSNMVASSDFRGLVVLQDVGGLAIARFGRRVLSAPRARGLGLARARHGGHGGRSAQSGGEQEIATAGIRLDGLHLTPPWVLKLNPAQTSGLRARRTPRRMPRPCGNSAPAPRPRRSRRSAAPRAPRAPRRSGVA